MNYSDFFQRLSSSKLSKYSDSFQHLLTENCSSNRHGKLPEWLTALNNLPDLKSDKIELKKSVSVGDACDITKKQRQIIEQQIRTLIPWRKGPFSLFGLDIDTEWRSDWKWDRVLPHIESLENKNVLDVGCGNGYHCWRMLGEQAHWVVGIEPSLHFIIQFEMIKHFMPKTSAVDVLPLTLEQLPGPLNYFDTCFSMGVLYHRRSPIDHLHALRNALKPGGELVLETLIIDGPLGSTFTPEDRYAQMRNVWFIPSVATLQQWLRRSGFENIRCVDINTTSAEEQRSTEWMPSHSLKEFLNPNNPQLTVEGHPAPKRATLIANRANHKS